MKKIHIILFFGLLYVVIGVNAQTWNCGQYGSSSVQATLSGSPGNYTLTINGTGVMDDYQCEIMSGMGIVTKAPWRDYYNSIKTVIINKGVTSIGNNAFYNCIGITSVTIGESVTYIKQYAFVYTSLSSLIIPDNVITIGQSAFMGCSALTSVSIGTGVTTVTGFRLCTSLKSVSMSKRVTTIDGGAFKGCSDLISIEIPNSVTTIGGGAFMDCTKLSTMIIPDNVTTINGSTFWGCSSLKSVTIPYGVTTIDQNAFDDCISLASITIPASVTFIAGYSFRNCKSLTNVTVQWHMPLYLWDANAFDGVNIRAVRLKVPYPTAAAYSLANVWKNFIIEEYYPPVITVTTHPKMTTNVMVGAITDNLSVSANVTLGAKLIYQWYSNTTNSNEGGSAISGATATNFNIPTTLTAGTYYYFCEVRATGGAASVRSEVATVNVAAPVITITSHPTLTTLTAGNITGILNVEASVVPQNATLSYQWYSNTTSSNTNGTAIFDATSENFTIPTNLTGGMYYYFCEVRATGGATPVRTNVATVNVVTPIITIYSQPATNTNVMVGRITESLSVTAIVTPQDATLSYQWYSNTYNSNIGGTAISGATSASFEIPKTLSVETYSYYFCEVRATGGAIPVRSNVARVYVLSAPLITITTQPAVITYVTEGSISGNLTVAASVIPQSETPIYQWYRNATASNTGGTAIDGANGVNFTIPTNLTTGYNYYYCEISATGGIKPVYSNVALVYVFPASTPVITIVTQPSAVTTVTEGDISGSLSVLANVTQGATLSYQWYSNTKNSNIGGTAISGATGASFTIPATLTLSGNPYYYFCEVSATGVSIPVRSNVAAVNVLAAGTPIITINTQPVASTNVVEGSITGSISISTSVSQGASTGYKWYSNSSNSNTGGMPLSGETSSVFVIPTTLTAGTYYYFCEVYVLGEVISVRSNVTTVNVLAAGTPVIIINSQPEATINVTEGNIWDYSLWVGASVTPWTISLDYQWYSAGTANNTDGSVIVGETREYFYLPTDLPAGTYYYFCEVRANGATSVRSNVATVIVTVPVTYTISASTLSSFGSLQTPYTQPAAQTVTITNTGTGQVTITQPTATYYDIGTLSTSTLATTGATATFTVRPKAGLAAGNYDETITINGTGGASATINASFNVTTASTYAISVSTLSSFGSLQTPYTQPAAQTVTITNTGTGQVTLTQPTAIYYGIGVLTTSTLATTGATATFTVRAKAGLAVGNYDETIVINGTGGASATVNVSFSVTAATTFTVTFNSMGGSAVPEQTATQGGKVTRPTDPMRTDYTFAGWYTDNGCTNAWNFASDIVTGNMTLYAKWTLKTVTGVVETWHAASLQIYPNPFADVVRINVGAGLAPAQHTTPALQLQVINAAGVVVHTQTITGPDETIRLEHLPAGMYFFRLEKDGKVKTEKMIKIQ